MTGISHVQKLPFGGCNNSNFADLWEMLNRFRNSRNYKNVTETNVHQDSCTWWFDIHSMCISSIQKVPYLTESNLGFMERATSDIRFHLHMQVWIGIHIFCYYNTYFASHNSFSIWVFNELLISLLKQQKGVAKPLISLSKTEVEVCPTMVLFFHPF